MENNDLSAASRSAGPSLLLTMMEAAALLRIGRTQTYELVMGGRIPSVTIGRRRLVVRSGLEGFIRDLMAGEDQLLPRRTAHQQFEFFTDKDL